MKTTLRLILNVTYNLPEADELADLSALLAAVPFRVADQGLLIGDTKASLEGYEGVVCVVGDSRPIARIWA